MAVGQSSTQTKPGLNWDSVILAYDRFLDGPSPENAASLARLLPRDVPDVGMITGDKAAALDHILSAENFGILSIEAELGNKHSIVVLFRLLNFADGFYGEEILGALGIVVRSQPRVFLEVMSENQDASLIRQFGPPVSYPSYAYNNHRGAFRYDLEKRMEALRSIKVRELADMKKVCLKRLAEELKGLK